MSELSGLPRADGAQRRHGKSAEIALSIESLPYCDFWSYLSAPSFSVFRNLHLYSTLSTVNLSEQHPPGMRGAGRQTFLGPGYRITTLLSLILTLLCTRAHSEGPEHVLDDSLTFKSVSS